jgi:hypothetical protein
MKPQCSKDEQGWNRSHLFAVGICVRCGRKSNPNKNKGKKIGMKR